jgi:hypothetical protein
MAGLVGEVICCGGRGTAPSSSLLFGESGISSEPPTRRRALAASAATAI